MKLFKKLAAAALAAVLALSMVGCGAGGTGSGDITGAVKDYLADQIKMNYGIPVEHKDELDTLAEKLIHEANEASEAKENKGKTALQLVRDATAGIENAQNYRFVLVKSTFTSNTFNDNKVKLFGNSLMDPLYQYKPKGYGLTNGKIGGTEYFLMLVKDPVTQINGENE